MDEPTLLAALADDLDLAFEALVRSRQDRVFSIALRILGDPTDAEDVAQDAFVRAYRALGGWPAARIRELRLDAWLATIVVNTARSRIRRRARTAARESLTFVDELDHPRSTPAETPDGRLARTEATEAWAIRLLALPERYRAPIVLRHVDGLGYDEIAERARPTRGHGQGPGPSRARPAAGDARSRGSDRRDRSADTAPTGRSSGPNHQPPTGDAAPDAAPLPQLQEVTR